jgi:class 3 adenylate cyclase
MAHEQFVIPQTMSRFRSSLRYKIGALMLLLSLGPLLVVNIIVLSATLANLGNFSARLAETEEALRTDVVGRNLAGAAGDTALVIDSYMLERITDVRRWSEESVIIEAARQGTLVVQQTGLAGLSSAEVQAQLQGTLFVPIPQSNFSPALSFLFRQTERPETPFVEILVTDATGINVLITRPITEVTHADTTWWQAARTQGVAGIGVTEVLLDAGVEAPVIGLALPVVDPDTKEVLGVIRALIRLTDLQRRLSQKAASVGANLRVSTADGRLIADTASNHSPLIIFNPAENGLAQNYVPALKANEARPGVEGAGFMVVNHSDGRDVVGYACTSDSNFYDAPAQLSGFEGFKWGVIVAQPESQALQVLARLIETGQAFERLPLILVHWFGIIFVLAGGVSLLGAILMSGNISRPLIEVSQAAQRVETGDLAARVEVRSRDEVGVLAHAFNAMTSGLRERERERDIFGRVVSPEVREKLLSGELRLGGETLWVAVLFTDIRGFSTLSEQMSPAEVVAFLNEYLEEMTKAVRPWGGYINNFIGDAIVVIFGAPVDQPDKEWHAVAAALTMQERLAALNRQRAARGEFPIHNGIGISTGEAVAGQIGSLERLMYTVIGDAVNVAARLEALTKDYPEHSILINGPTAKALHSRHDLSLKCLGPVTVKGRTEPVDVFAVIGWEKSETP